MYARKMSKSLLQTEKNGARFARGSGEILNKCVVWATEHSFSLALSLHMPVARCVCILYKLKDGTMKATDKVWLLQSFTIDPDVDHWHYPCICL
jgi:hypothetical protein